MIVLIPAAALLLFCACGRCYVHTRRRVRKYNKVQLKRRRLQRMREGRPLPPMSKRVRQDAGPEMAVYVIE